MQNFACPRCGAVYTVTVRSEPAKWEPKCEDCETEFPDQKGRDWLHYKRHRDTAAAS